MLAFVVLTGIEIPMRCAESAQLHAAPEAKSGGGLGGWGFHPHTPGNKGTRQNFWLSFCM
jgi:hypothetical protein